jgi:hypothetical protein
MPQPRSEAQQHFTQRYAAGSVGAALTKEQRRAFERWLKDRHGDQLAMERGLGSPWPQRSRSHDFAET